MNEIETIISREDLTKNFDKPIPFLSHDGTELGEVVKVWWDGKYTRGLVRTIKPIEMPKERSVGL